VISGLSREGDYTVQRPNFASFALNAREFMGQSKRLYAGTRIIPRARPGQWTVVGIALGVGTGEGARPYKR